MSNSFYNHGSFPTTGSSATSASMRAELDLVGAAFDKMPTLSGGNANMFVLVNSTGTALTASSTLPSLTVNDTFFVVQDDADNTRKFRFEATSITPGATRILTVPDADLTIVGTATTQTLTNKTLGAFTISGTVAGGGNQINNVIIGTTTPLAGAFTTLTASTSITNSGLTSGRVSYTTTAGLQTDSSNFLYNGTNLSVGTTSAAQGLNVGGGLQILNSATLPATGTPLLFSYENPVSRIYMGDGTGYSFALSKRASSTTTDLVTLTDGGNLSIGQTSTQGARFSVYGGALATSSSGLAISSALTAGRLTSGDTNNATAYIGNFLDLSITELSAGSSGALTSGIVAFGGTAAVNPNTVKTYTGGQVRTTVDASGNLLVGTTTSTARLNVINTGDANKQIVFSDSITYYGSVSHNSGNGLNEYRTESAGGHGFFKGTSATANMTLDSSGNLGIGATSAGNKLQISNGGANGVEVDVTVSSGTQSKILSINRTTSAYTPLNFDAASFTFLTSGSPRASISAAGVFDANTLQTSGAAGVGAFSASKWFIQSEDANTIRAYFTGPNSSTYGSYFIYNALSTGTPLRVLSFSPTETVLGIPNTGLSAVNIATTGRFTATYGSYADPSLASSGSTGLQIYFSASYNDNSLHTITGYASTSGVIYIRQNGVSAIPFYCNGGGGIAYQWTILNPQTGAWVSGSGP